MMQEHATARLVTLVKHQPSLGYLKRYLGDQQVELDAFVLAQPWGVGRYWREAKKSLRL